MNWPDLKQVSIVIFSNADPGACVRILTDCERLEHDGLEFEVILVLQGLTEKVEAMLKGYPYSFAVKFITADKDVNRAIGRNLGAKAAKYEIILFLDSALEVSPGLLHRHLETYTTDNTAAVMGEIFLPKFVKKNRWFRYLDGDYRSARRWAAHAGTKLSPPLRYVNTANFSVRRQVYQAVGGHTESIDHPEAEDIDLAHRVKSGSDNEIRLQPEAVAFCLHAPLKESMKSKYEFGREGIPKLLEFYPDLYCLLPSRFVKTPGFTITKPFFRQFMSLLFTPPVLFVARAVRLLGPEFISFRMMRYMLQYEAVRGVRQAVKGVVTGIKV